LSPTNPPDPDRPAEDEDATKQAGDAPDGHAEQPGQTTDSGAAAYDTAARSTPQDPTPAGAETYADAAHADATNSEDAGTTDAG
jgi:hypothetical protein